MDAGKKMDMFKLGLVRSVDPHFTRQVMTVEVDFWWVGVPKMSSAVAIDAKSKWAAGGTHISNVLLCEQSSMPSPSSGY